MSSTPDTTPQFPTAYSKNSTAGPSYNTTVISLDNGMEQRNSNWSYPRQVYNIAYPFSNVVDIEAIDAFFHGVKGKWKAFRYKDWSDYKSCSILATVTMSDQIIGVGDGVEEHFQLVKTYTSGTNSLVRKITRPINGTVLVSVNNVSKTENTHWTIDYGTGLITFTGGNIPAYPLVVRAGFEFDVYCRFDNDNLLKTIEDYGILRIDHMNFIEVKEED